MWPLSEIVCWSDMSWSDVLSLFFSIWVKYIELEVKERKLWIKISTKDIRYTEENQAVPLKLILWNPIYNNLYSVLVKS